MDAFRTHKQVISEYEDYLYSFINIRDSRINEYVKGNKIKQELLPPPLVQFNPAYEKKETFDDLLNEGIIESDLVKAINLFPPFRHQVEAIRLGVEKLNNLWHYHQIDLSKIAKEENLNKKTSTSILKNKKGDGMKNLWD